jgi:hypothetical protein
MSMTPEQKSFAWTFVIFFGSLILTAIGISIYLWGWWGPFAAIGFILAVGFLKRAFMTSPPSGNR